MRFGLSYLLAAATAALLVAAELPQTQPETLSDLRKLLADSNPQVRLQAALKLVERNDEQAVGVLIQLLAELPVAERPQIEQVLQQLAGEWSPNPVPFGRDIWADWWRKQNGPALVSAFRERTLDKDAQAKALALIDQLGDKSFAKREQAVIDLVAMGSSVRRFLDKATRSADLEQTLRAQACLKQIEQNQHKEKLPFAAPRLLAIRKPEGAAAALLAYLPFTDDYTMKAEVGKALKSLVQAMAKPDPAVFQALSDSLPIRRIAAAEALASVGGADHWPIVRKLLADPDPEVRLRVAVALVYAQDKQAVPALIDLVAELPRNQAWEAEELLLLLAGAKGPAHLSGDDTAARKKLQTAWQAWWKEHGATVNLAALDKAACLSGLTIVAEVVPTGNKKGVLQLLPNAAGGGTGRLVGLDRDKQRRWQIANLDHPVDFQVLLGSRVLIAEYAAKRVTERDLTGKILWEATNLPGFPTNVQRLANGNTFIALYFTPFEPTKGVLLVEVDRQGKTVATFKGEGPTAVLIGKGITYGAHKMADGRMICVSNGGDCIWMDAHGKLLKRFPVVSFGADQRNMGNIDVTVKGHILIAQQNKVVEYDSDGKFVWETNVAGNRATRLGNGNTLVGSEANGVTELDPKGQVVWQYQPPAGFQVTRARRP